MSVHVSDVGVKTAVPAWGELRLGTMPAGYRPSANAWAAVYSSPATACLCVRPDGAIMLISRDHAVAVGANIEASLSYVAT